MPYGTVSLSDLLQTKNQTVLDIGEEEVAQVFQDNLDAHNRLTGEMVADLVEDTTEDSHGIGGALDEMDMEGGTEFSRPLAQKVTALANQGYPLRRDERALQWTRDAFEQSSAAEITQQFVALMTADLRRRQKRIRDAVFGASNYDWEDYLVNRKILPVKRLRNADGGPIPIGPNGDVFNGATHTHYLASATLTTAALDSLIDTVREHWSTGTVRLEIPRAAVVTVRGFTGTGQFSPILDARLVPPPGGTSYVARGALDVTNRSDQQIGIYGEAEVYVKWRIPTSYILCRIVGAVPKVLKRRIRSAQAGSLRLIFEEESHPLRARAWRREEGFGVSNRDGAAVLYYAGGTYVDPTF